MTTVNCLVTQDTVRMSFLMGPSVSAMTGDNNRYPPREQIVALHVAIELDANGSDAHDDLLAVAVL